MNKHPDNPITNALSPGITESDVGSAITKSGYPLQTIVASWLRHGCLRDWFSIGEEWSYVDRDSGESRTLDIHAAEYLYDIEKRRPKVRPVLNLFIECKQSELPYVFFLSSIERWIPDFPMFSGLAGDSRALVVIQESNRGTNVPILEALELKDHPFLTSSVKYASTFSKCERAGNNLKLSGSESYNQIVLPLLKAAAYFHEVEKPTETARYFDCHLSLCVGVLNAPMIGVQVTEDSHELQMLPWVRVIRHQSEEIPSPRRWKKVTAIDVVHKDFFQSYMNEHVRPFLDEFSERVFERQRLLARGDITSMKKEE
jgi:hypothetical protein